MRFRILALLLLCLAAPFTVQAQDANCGGSLVGHKNVYADGTKVGELQVYWNGAKQKNCARFMHAGPSWGEERLTGVSLGICRNRQDRLCNHPDNDPNADRTPGRSFAFDLNQYSFRAGPVETGLRNDGKCMRAAGYIRWKGVIREAVMYGFCD
jgi:hypothetical protein